MTSPIRFAAPPVMETICGAYFSPPQERAAVFPALAWSRCFSAEFPGVEERPPLELPAVEAESEPSLQWSVRDRPPILRLWAASTDGQHVVQCQVNALLSNWLRPTCGNYLQYSLRRDQFFGHLQKLQDFARTERFVEQLNWRACMLSYINHIRCEAEESPAQVLRRTLRCFAAEWSDGWLPAPNHLQFHATQALPNGRGIFVVDALPTTNRQTGAKLIRFELAARGRVQGVDLNELRNWFDLAHDCIVNGFASLTTEQMHQAWGRDHDLEGFACKCALSSDDGYAPRFPVSAEDSSRHH